MSMDRSIPDHPDVREIERYGTLRAFAMTYPVCPACGGEAETFYRKTRYGDIIGCDGCLYETDAAEEYDE